MAELLTKHTAYPLHQLSPGDRFYFVNDKKKQVLTLDDPPFENRRLRGRYWFKFANCLKDGIYPGITKAEQHKADRVVIFLRNKNDQQ